MRRPQRALKRRLGFTLLEALIALLIVAVGLIGASALQLFSLRGTTQGLLRSQATALANDMAERLRANRVAARSGAYNQDMPDCDSAAPDSCISARLDCTAAQLAAADLYAVACNGASKLLPGGEATVDCPAPAVCDIAIRWREQADRANPEGPVIQEVRLRIQP